jgi:hypothetical protein
MYAAGAVSAWRFEFDKEAEEKNFKVRAFQRCAFASEMACFSQLQMSIALHEASSHEQFAKTVSDQDVEWVTRALENDLDMKDDYKGCDIFVLRAGSAHPGAVLLDRDG